MFVWWRQLVERKYTLTEHQGPRPVCTLKIKVGFRVGVSQSRTGGKPISARVENEASVHNASLVCRIVEARYLLRT